MTKHTHETAQNPAGRMNCVSLCGRLVGRLSLTSGDAVTCPKCRAKQVRPDVTFRVSADIRYLDGTLAGIDIPAGFTTTQPDRAAADRCVAWISKTRTGADFVRATGTGNRYVFTSEPRVDEFRVGA